MEGVRVCQATTGSRAEVPEVQAGVGRDGREPEVV